MLQTVAIANEIPGLFVPIDECCMNLPRFLYPMLKTHNLYGGTFGTVRFVSSFKIPKLAPMANWYYATDVPNKKPYEPDFKPKRPPRKFKQFPKHDSDKLELAYTNQDKTSHLVRVSEDELFHVDLNDMTLTSIYWKGAVFEVRRGVWFDKHKVPLPHKLTQEIERHMVDWKHNKDKLTKLQSNDDENFNEEAIIDKLASYDLCKLENTSKEWGKYIFFVGEGEAYLLPNLDGGKLHLSYLKTTLAQYLTINGKRITNSIIEKQTVECTDSSSESESDSERTENAKKLSDYPSLTWNFFDAIMSNSNQKAGNSDIINSNNSKETFSFTNKVVESDYDDQDNSSSELQKRNVDHLVLCVHGIAQTLGKKYEYINFAHSINLIRRNMKQVYEKTSDIKLLNKENNKEDWLTNCNVQVLPITWRHSIGFETDRIKNVHQDPNLPTMSDVTIRNVLPIRQLVNDVVVDVGLYEDPFYKNIIITEVCRQLNDTYKLFKENTGFDGQVHLMGHSLGSSILYDIVSDSKNYKLDFDVNRFFCLGSPIGLFKVIQRTTLLPQNMEKSPTLNSDQPNCKEIYNIFHSTDPVAHRMEPLVDPTMAQYDYETIPHLLQFDGIASKLLGIGGSIKDKIVETVSRTNLPDALEKDNPPQLPYLLKEKLLNLNHRGRIDYAMPPNLFEVDLISAIISHMLYFEDLDVAGFMLKEILTKSERAKTITVVPFQDDQDST